jgi:hypothetical protein
MPRVLIFFIAAVAAHAKPVTGQAGPRLSVAHE